MTFAAEKETEQHGESRGGKHPDHDLVHELSRRLDALRRYEQYIADAEGHAFLQEFWTDLQCQDRENVKRLKELLVEEIK